MGNQEGSIQIGLKSPNVLGKGEKFQVDYSYGTKKSNQFNIGISKPLHEYGNHGSIPSLNVSGKKLKNDKYLHLVEDSEILFHSKMFREINSFFFHL